MCLTGRRTLSILAFVLAFALATAFAQTDQDDGIGTPRFATTGGVATVPRTTNTVPHWTSSFTYDGVIYPFTMVGTDPSSTDVTTVVDTAIIPVKFVFANGSSLDGGSKLLDISGSGNTLGSPNFQDASYSSGDTQFADAVQRAEFWASVSTTSQDWHVLLGSPTVYPTQIIAVPSNQAVELIGRNSGKLLALMSEAWFNTRLQNLINKLHIAPTTLPIIQTYNTFLFVHSLADCCILGYHGAFSSLNGNGNQQVQTFIYEAWTDPGIFSSASVQDVLPLSHEVSEWMNDPFVHNFVPPWQFPGIPGSCQGNLETGDPLEVLAKSDFPVTVSGFTYHPQTEALLPWFSRQDPSLAIDGAYSYPDTTALVAPSQPCQ